MHNHARLINEWATECVLCPKNEDGSDVGRHTTYDGALQLRQRFTRTQQWNLTLSKKVTNVTGSGCRGNNDIILRYIMSLYIVVAQLVGCQTCDI